jgi:hypothetical protein
MFRIFSNVQHLFSLCSECSEYLAQKLVCSEFDFVVKGNAKLGISPRLKIKGGINKGSKGKKTGLKYLAGIDKNPVYSVAGFDRFIL